MAELVGLHSTVALTAPAGTEVVSVRDTSGNAKSVTIDDLLGSKTDEDVGTAATGTTVAEYGAGGYHRTVLTVDTTLPAIAGGAALAVGKLLYTFPAGVIVVRSAYISLAIQQTEANITADTPDGGLGTTIASGAVAVLGGTAAFENIMTGQTFDDCDGTAEVKTVASDFVIEAAGDHTVYFNVADTWAADGDAAAGLSGTVVLTWEKVA